MDPWGLLEDGECKDKNFAYITLCITEEELVLTTCLASLCALLVTTDPNCVVALVNRWVYRVAGQQLLQSGVLPVLAPEWAPLYDKHPYAHLQHRTYTFAKFEAFRMTQYRAVATFDADVLFLRNASGLRDMTPFAASRTPKGRDPSLYINSGVMVLQPSLVLYNDLINLWRDGLYTLSYSDDDHAEQDVVTEHCVRQGYCGPVFDLDACVYNHGSWLPGHFWRECAVEAVVARHNFRAAREEFVAGILQTAMYRGTCRARTGAILAKCWGEGFTREGCCTSRPPWGNALCWGAGFSYERCCVGIDDAERLRSDLLHVGTSWYGLTSVPHPTPTKLFGSQCWRQYSMTPYTFVGMSSLFYSPPNATEELLQAATQDIGEPPPWMLAWAIKCEGLGSPHVREPFAAYVQFRFRATDYLRHFVNRSAVPKLHRIYLERGPHFRQRLKDTIATCVPKECCMAQPAGVGSSLVALRLVIWHLLIQFVFGLPEHAHVTFMDNLDGMEEAFQRIAPLPLDSHLDDVYQIGPAGRRVCYRK